MYKLEFGEELFIIIIIIIYKKIFRDLDLTCIKEFCDTTMILEKEKSCTSALTHTHTEMREKHLTFLFFSYPIHGGKGGCFLKQAQIFMDSSKYTKSRVVSVSKCLAGQFGVKAGPFLCHRPAVQASL